MARPRKIDYTGMPGLFDDLNLPPVPDPRPSGPRPPVDSRPVYYISFGSGSSGNCAYIGDGTTGILIDAGIDPDRIHDALKRNGISPDTIKGIIVTHDHGDHVRYVYSLVRKNRGILVYCTPKCFNGIMRRHSVSRRLKDYHKPIYKEFEFKIGDFTLTAFDVSHDGTDNAGFYISHGAVTFTVATDLGCITDRVDHYMRRAKYIQIEANYDAEMLRNGPYPEYLKARIAAANGHLDNVVTGNFLADIYTPALRNIFLCHLSLDNNSPEAAVKAVRAALATKHPALVVGDGSYDLLSREAPLQLMPLPRFDASPLFRLLP